MKYKAEQLGAMIHRILSGAIGSHNSKHLGTMILEI